MKEAIVSKGLVVEIVDSPVPEPTAGQVLIKIAVSGTNPKDWKVPEAGASANHGDDIAGVVAKVGPNVTEFKVGDRVAAFHEMFAPHGSFADYGIAWEHTTFHIPASTSFEEAATLPLAYLTAVYGLYKELQLPDPWHVRPDDAPALPLVIYGASTAVGAFAIQLARRSNIHPIIGIAGASSALVKDLLTNNGGDDNLARYGDAIVDYRQGEAAVLQGVKDALAKAAPLYKGGKALELKHGFDPATYEGGYITLSKLLVGSSGTRLATVSPKHDYKEIDERTEPLEHLGKTYVGDAHSGSGSPTPLQTADRDLAYVYSRYATKGLQQGWLKAHPYEVVPGGLGGVGRALRDLKDGKAHGIKYVLRIADSEGVEK
ncbi:zinc-binding oxidoreductase [Ophiostoma piceae UAMH 11346]|uniref:Zinc-binding oxidoreductase n=1 Tax=Ophiostoma piceae (strain UAMH 11346) TaxID=1262450 RepID=S3C1Y0_OPHP1|nr:zinc-binding oxidoreductase [Ophiostoma piceae UAMH 11346]